MRFVDSYMLPDPIKRAVEWQEKSHNPASDVSCTTLIDSPLRVWLKRNYYDQIVEEYSDRLWALYGTLAHLVVEKFGGADDEQVECEAIVVVNGWKVSAKMDYIKSGDVLTDYKFTSVWSTAEGLKIEWERQTNVGLWLLRHSPDEKLRKLGESIKRMEVCAMFRDWVPSIQDKFPTKIATIPAPIWDDAYAENYIMERVQLHQNAVADLKTPPPPCSDKERWVKGFAVMKDGRKNAIKAKIKTFEEAEKLMADLGGTHIRESESTRCLRYCTYGAQGFCPWWDVDNKELREAPMVRTEAPDTATDPDHIRKSEGEGLQTWANENCVSPSVPS